MNRTSAAWLMQNRRAQAAARVWVGALLAVFSLLLARVVQLKLAPPEPLAAKAGAPYSTNPELARRGDLLDRQGRILATSAVGYRLFVDPQIVEDPITIAVEIASLIGGDPVEYDRQLARRPDSRYVVLNHLLTDGQVEAIRQAGLRGVGLEPRLVRDYTTGAVGGLLIGKVGFEHAGQAGMEHRFNERMSPSNGRFTVLRDSSGQPLWIEPSGYVERQDGMDVRLSLDMVVQDIAERRLRDAVKEFNAGGGRLVVLDVQSGEILAMCDLLRKRPGWEDFTSDPGREIHPSLGRNRCATDPYEPGSTFKPFIWAFATELGRATPEEVLPTPLDGPHRTSRGRRIRDVKYYGPMTWETVLVKSMNSGMAIVAERMTEREMQQAVRAFGFGQRTSADLPGETAGLVTDPRKWTHYSQTSVAMGHEIGVTPLQMVQAFCAFARDGTMPELRLTALEGDEEYVPVVRRIISPEIAELTRQTMRHVMTEGTGRRAQSEWYTMFGKSGTAQLPMPKGGGYYEDRYVSSFIAGAPLKNTRIVVLCVIDDPDRAIAHYGGIVAGPAARDVIDQTLGYLGVPRDVAPPIAQAD